VSSPFRGYDHRYIGDLADLVVLMAYNFQDPDTPSPVAPFDQVDNAIRQESELVSPDKIILGVPAYGVIYGVSEEGQASVLALPPSKDGIAGFPEYPGVSTLDAGREGENVSPAFVPEFLCNYVEWEGMDRSYKAYFEDARSLEARVLMAHGYGLRGVAVWRLGLLPENWWGRF
jgi:spore germination protein YaaH